MSSRLYLRSAPALHGRTLSGYAAVYGQRTNLGGGQYEVIEPGALDDALSGSDVRALWQHDPAQVLGRQASGTLRLRSDEHGLWYEVDLPDTTLGRDVLELVSRGDIDGSSFAFAPGETRYDAATGTVHQLRVDRVMDVSPVTYPAYAGSSVQARSEAPTGARRRSQIIRASARGRR